MRKILGLTIALGLIAAACGDMAASPDTTTTTTAGSPDPVGAALSPSEGVGRAEVAQAAPVGGLAAGLNGAGLDLWRSQPVEENLVFSPMSIGHALLMARAAADAATGSAIDEAFGLPEGLAAHEAWNAADQAMAADAGSEQEIQLSIADRIWPRTGLEPDQEWIDLLASRHGAMIEALDFAGDPSGSRETINSWVGDQTQGLIPELLPEGFIDARTALVLTDAVYFEARWASVFGKYANVSDVFTRLDGTTVETEYMRELELGDRRGRGDGFVGAEVPYVGGDFSMLVVVPEEGRFDEVRTRLDQDLIDEIDATFETGPYELLLPRWESHTQLDLFPWLRDLGAAPGSYPAISPEAFLDGAVHGADIAVDEWGTVAAAATGLGFDESGPPEPELTIAADKPFLYLIRHRPTGLVLFAGQVTDPVS